MVASLVARTLTTVLDFKEDLSGLKRYEAGISRVKTTILTTAAGLAGGLAAAFTAEKIGQFILGLSNAGQEINKLHEQINGLLRPADDMKSIQEGLVKTAQTVGQSYVDVAKTFKGFLNDSQEANISQEELLSTTENIYKSLAVSKASAEETKQVMDVMGSSFRMGKMNVRALNTLNDLSPDTYKTLLAGIGGTSEELTKLAKDGKLTSEVILKAFSKTNNELTRKFDAVPKSMTFAFQYLYNQMALAVAHIYKTLDATKYLAKGIIWLTDKIVGFVKGFFTLFGGLGNVLRVLGIALMLVFGPALIRQLALATLGIVKFGIATIAATWPWLLLGAAVLAVAVAIEDFLTWIEGGESITGELLGPFEDLKKALMDSDFVKFFSKVIDVFSMSFEEAWTKVRDLLFQLGKDIGVDFEGAWNAIAGVIDRIGGILSNAFNVAWGVIKPILDSITDAVVNGFHVAVEAASKLISGEFAGSFDIVGKAIDVIKIALTGIAKIITDTIIYGIDLLKLAITAVSQLIAGDFTGAWETLKQLYQGVIDLITNNFVTIWNTIKEAASPVVEILKEFAGWIQKVAEYFGLWNNVSFENLTKAIQAVSDMVTKLIGYIQSAWDLVSNAPTIVGDAVAGARDRVAAGAGAVGGAIARGGAAVGEAAGSVMGGARRLLGFGEPAPGAQATPVAPIMPGVPPGGMPGSISPSPFELLLPDAAPTAAPVSIAPSIVQHNNITVQALSPDGAEIAGAVRREMDRANVSAADATARSIQAATPRVEAARQ